MVNSPYGNAISVGNLSPPDPSVHCPSFLSNHPPLLFFSLVYCLVTPPPLQIQVCDLPFILPRMKKSPRHLKSSAGTVTPWVSLFLNPFGPIQTFSPSPIPSPPSSRTLISHRELPSFLSPFPPMLGSVRFVLPFLWTGLCTLTPTSFFPYEVA